MHLISFKDWLASQRESTAFTRARAAGALGLMPPKDHEGHRHSTFIFPKKKSKTNKKKKEAKPLEEAKRTPVKDPRTDSWLQEIGLLKSKIDELRGAVEKKKRSPKKDDKKEPDKPDNARKRVNDAEDSDMESKVTDREVSKDNAVSPDSNSDNRSVVRGDRSRVGV